MMKLISLLLASVEASKLTSRASAKNKAQFLSGTEFDSLFSDLNDQLDALNAYDYTYTNDWDTNWDSGYSNDDWQADLDSWNTDYSYGWDTDYSTNWWETPETNYDAGSCVNTDNGAQNWYNEDCTDYEANPSWCGFWDGNGFVSEDMCCICGGGDETATVEPEIPAPVEPAAGQCVNTDNGAMNWWNEDCTDYEAYPDLLCGFWDGNGFVSEDMCCACGGGETAPVEPVTPVEPVAPVEPVIPVEPETEQCFWWNEQEWAGVASSNPAWTVCGLDVCTPCGTQPAGQCVNTDNGAMNDWNEDCSDYEANPSWCGFWNGNGFVSEDMCCVCDGGETVGAPEADLCEANEDKADSYGDTCYEYWSNPHWCGHTNTGFDSNADCCACQ